MYALPNLFMCASNTCNEMSVCIMNNKLWAANELSPRWHRRNATLRIYVVCKWTVNVYVTDELRDIQRERERETELVFVHHWTFCRVCLFGYIWIECLENHNERSDYRRGKATSLRMNRIVTRTYSTVCVYSIYMILVCLCTCERVSIVCECMCTCQCKSYTLSVKHLKRVHEILKGERIKSRQ